MAFSVGAVDRTDDAYKVFRTIMTTAFKDVQKPTTFDST